jgi:hypothetical protein
MTEGVFQEDASIFLARRALQRAFFELLCRGKGKTHDDGAARANGHKLKPWTGSAKPRTILSGSFDSIGGALF